MSDKDHIWIPKLKQQLSDRLISRREFVRYSTLLGMSAGAAYMWAGKITGDSKTEAEGKADQVEGKVQNTVGGIKDTVKDAFTDRKKA